VPVLEEARLVIEAARRTRRRDEHPHFWRCGGASYFRDLSSGTLAGFGDLSVGALSCSFNFRVILKLLFCDFNVCYAHRGVVLYDDVKYGDAECHYEYDSEKRLVAHVFSLSREEDWSHRGSGGAGRLAFKPDSQLCRIGPTYRKCGHPPYQP